MIKIKASTKSQLNEHQIIFIKMAYARLEQIAESLDFDIINSEIRLFYIRELYSIYSELNKIPLTRTYANKGPSIEDETRLNDLKQTVSFVRNVLMHFPLFKCWDDIWISKNFAKYTSVNQKNDLKNSSIVKYLIDCNNRLSYSYKLTMKNNSKDQIFTVRYPKDISDEEKIYLKDILSEKDGVISIISIMDHIF